MRLTADDLARRAKLQLWIDRQDAKRGRPLTEREKLANLERAMTHCWGCDAFVGWAERCPRCGKELV